MPLRDLTGQQFGRLTVIEPAGRTAAGKMCWKCLCACGKEHVVSGSNLVAKPRGRKTRGTRSCGCLHREMSAAKGRAKAIEMRCGQRFGRLEILGRAPRQPDQRQVVWLCRCDCGRETRVSGSSIRNGSTRSCGCLKAELLRNRAEYAGTIIRDKVCLECGRPFKAIGPQKWCSDPCWLAHNARKERQKRGVKHRDILLAQIAHAEAREKEVKP